MNSTISITCPADGDKILSYYQGYYDSVYILFHPFIKAKQGFEFDFENDYPDRRTVAQNFDKIKWSEMLKECAFDDFRTLDIALRNSIGGLVKKYKNQEDVEKLERICQQLKIIEPSEGRFQEHLIEDMLSSIRELDYQKIIFGNEWADQQETKLIADLESKNYDFEASLDLIPNNLFTEDRRILYSVHWDSHFTLLCSDAITPT